MKNAHLRFGWLTYVKCTEKTTTSIKFDWIVLSEKSCPIRPGRQKRT